LETKKKIQKKIKLPQALQKITFETLITCDVINEAHFEIRPNFEIQPNVICNKKRQHGSVGTKQTLELKCY
jgi:hypothetical protein